ncbi:amidohydrolase family protein [Thermostilla marina]
MPSGKRTVHVFSAARLAGIDAIPSLRGARVYTEAGRVVGITGIVAGTGGEPFAIGNIPSDDALIHLERHALGEVVLTPAFVDAHVHLELSQWNEPLPGGESFTEWVRRVIAFRQSEAYDRRAAVAEGTAECLAAGTLAVEDIAQPGTTGADYRIARQQGCCRTGESDGEDIPIDITAYFEIIDPGGDREEQWLPAAEAFIDDCRRHGIRPGLSPHAPYTVPFPVLQKVIDLACRKCVPVAMHVAETAAEAELLAHRTGPFRRLLEERGLWNESLRPREITMGDYLRELARAPAARIIHGRYLRDAELRFVAEHADRMALVVCPLTHEQFGREAYPVAFAKLPNVAVGSDSRASSPVLRVSTSLERLRAWGWARGMRLWEIGTGRTLSHGPLFPAVGAQADFLVWRVEGDGDRVSDRADTWYDAILDGGELQAIYRRGRRLVPFGDPA